MLPCSSPARAPVAPSPSLCSTPPQVCSWFNIGSDESLRDWGLHFGDFILFRNHLATMHMTKADLAALQERAREKAREKAREATRAGATGIDASQLKLPDGSVAHAASLAPWLTSHAARKPRYELAQAWGLKGSMSKYQSPAGLVGELVAATGKRSFALSALQPDDLGRLLGHLVPSSAPTPSPSPPTPPVPGAGQPSPSPSPPPVAQPSPPPIAQPPPGQPPVPPNPPGQPPQTDDSAWVPVRTEAAFAAYLANRPVGALGAQLKKVAKHWLLDGISFKHLRARREAGLLGLDDKMTVATMAVADL